MNPRVTASFHEPTSSLTYVVEEPEGEHCVVIDPVLDYEPASSKITTTSIDKVISYIREHDLKVDWVLETHAHADHLTAAPYVREQVGGKVAIGEHIVEVQKTWQPLLNLDDEFKIDGSQFDHLFKDGEEFSIGAMAGKILYTPGHTKADVTYLIGDAAFIGDTLFMPDYGSARADFPGGDAHSLYRSIQALYALPPATRLFLCHDYLTSNRKEHCWETSVTEQQESNVQVNGAISEEEFVKFRTQRDKELAPPRLLFPSVQLNIRAGHVPPPESNGQSYLKIPIKRD